MKLYFYGVFLDVSNVDFFFPLSTNKQKVTATVTDILQEREHVIFTTCKKLIFKLW